MITNNQFLSFCIVKKNTNVYIYVLILIFQLFQLITKYSIKFLNPIVKFSQADYRFSPNNEFRISFSS